MNPEDYLNQLKRDYDSCQLPEYYDPSTQRSLYTIAQSIIDGDYTMSAFRSYVDSNFHLKSFHDGCIETVMDYIIDNAFRKREY